MGFNKISRASRDQTWKEDIITNGLGRVEGIAVDWIAGKFSGYFIIYNYFILSFLIYSQAILSGFFTTYLFYI